MRSEKNSTTQNAPSIPYAGSTWPSRDAIRFPGLTPGSKKLRGMAQDLPKRWAIFSYKQFMPCLWVVFVGGTGTGKSTVFNAFCGKPLSDTGVERPKTRGPIAYAHKDCPIEEGFPLVSIEIERRSDDSLSSPATGNPGSLLVLDHGNKELSHLVLVDTPDIDSVEVGNRQAAEDLYALSDAVVFLASQEKYADQVPYQFLLKVLEEKKAYFLILNKAHEQLSQEDVLEILKDKEITFEKGRIWLIPYTPSQPSQQISENSAFRDFILEFSQELSKDDLQSRREETLSTRAQDLKLRLVGLLDLLEQESHAAQDWLVQLETLFKKASHDLIKEERERFATKSREYLRTEIRRLFARYDILAKPRQLIRQILLTPFRFLGFRKEVGPGPGKEELLKIGRKVDLAPLQTALESFNRMVLERLSPWDEEAPLFKEIRKPGVLLKNEEVETRIWTEQVRLAGWLEETFQRLADDFPRTKKWGIYSTSILWGVLILAFETTVGGGFTVLDAALDSALAPFVTKGATELFAYHEIQKIARELARRYQDGLLSVLRTQRDRYRECLESLATSRETLESLRSVLNLVEGWRSEVIN